MNLALCAWDEDSCNCISWPRNVLKCWTIYVFVFSLSAPLYFFLHLVVGVVGNWSVKSSLITERDTLPRPSWEAPESWGTVTPVIITQLPAEFSYWIIQSRLFKEELKKCKPQGRVVWWSDLWCTILVSQSWLYPDLLPPPAQRLHAVAVSTRN